MIIYPVGTRGINYQAAYNNLIIDWNARGIVPVPPAPTPTYLSDWILGYQLLFGGVIFDWGTNGVFSGYAHGSSASSTGNLQFVFSGNSLTNGSVTAFNDGIINVPLITLTAKFPIVRACIDILASVGQTGRPYKLDIVKNGVILFTVRSVYWGTQMADETTPMYELVDRQTQATINPPI